MQEAVATREPKGTILVVDDDELTRDAVSVSLEEEGYRVTACEDATQALSGLRGGLAPDVILLDLMMPGIDGWEFRLIQKAHERWSQIPVIAVSADVSAKAAAIDAEAFLPKPVCLDTLIETVRRLASASLRARSGAHEANLSTLRDLGNMAAGVVEQMSPLVGSLSESLKLAVRQTIELERRLSSSEAFSLLGIRQLLHSAIRNGDRVRQVVDGVSMFSEFALHATQRTRRVLIAHSEPRLAFLMREALLDDHQVLVLHTGAEAARALGEDSFDVVLCEMLLPDMHGIDLYDVLLAERPEQAKRMVFLTTPERFGDRERNFFARHHVWQLKAPYRASDVREIIDARWRSFH